MTYLSLSRAARLAGVTRAALQARIRRGEIATFEGAVAASDLLRLYPAVSLSDDGALERVEQIRDQAQPRAEGFDAALPTPEVLLSRLRGMRDRLAEQTAALHGAQTLLAEVGQRLHGLSAAEPATLARELAALAAWFQQARAALAEPPPPDGPARLLANDTLLRIIAAHVKVIPSGHDYFVEGAESLLEASVRAGLKLSYGCSSGNCGTCKVRLISGEVARIRDHDYVIGEREKQMGYLLACAHTAVTDLVLEAAEALSVDDLPAQDIRATLRRIESLSPSLMVMQVQTPRTQTLRFMAGQRARLSLEDGLEAELPIASCPCNGRYLWFLVRRGEDAWSQALFAQARPGLAVRLRGPTGRFILDEESAEPAIFIACGDGIAPIKSLIEQAVSIDRIESFHLYWDCVHPEGHYQGQWVRALTDALDQFRFTPLVSGQPAALLARLRDDHADASLARYYLAGPESMVEPLRQGLEQLGVPTDRLALEFTAT